ncbi:sulfatase-like hydrolase/transferase [Georgenia deserti]|uniref:sulfatase-like hydrolase/transferase n=1 Tax=Georgenia deserti TaxID=2093781 RepID=UPI0036D8B2D8
MVLMTDQHRAGLTAGEGGRHDTMPRLDALLDSGARFDRAYTTSPACVPARTSLLTGRFPTAHRVRQNSTAASALYERDLLDVLRSAGYSLHFCGKPHMHRGPDDFDSFHGPYMHEHGPRRTPEDAAFDEWLHGLDHRVAGEPSPHPVSAQLPYRIVSDAVDVLDQVGDDRPFFLWVSFPEPHNPYQVPEPYFSMFGEQDVPPRLAGPEALEDLSWRYRWLHRLISDKRPGFDDEWRRYRANYLGMLRLLDDQIGRLLDHLGDRLEDTVVVFLSDHGDYVGEYGLQRKGAGMSEALMRVPFGVAGPGVVTGRHRELVSLADVLPTVCDWLDQDLPAGVQGRSLAPLLIGAEGPPEEFGSMLGELGYGGVSYDETDRPPLHFPYEGTTFDELNSVTQSGGLRMLVTERYKLLVDDRGEEELYDLDMDPAEQINRVDDPEVREVRDELRLLLVRWMIRAADDLPVGQYMPKTRPHNWRWVIGDTGPADTPGSELAPAASGSGAPDN